MTYAEILDAQRKYWKSGETKCVKKRMETLNTLKKMLSENQKEIDEAVYNDLKRQSTEAAHSLAMVDELLAKLEEWSKPQKVPILPPMDSSSDSMMLVRESVGCVLVIAPWNFPHITSMPLASALAGGNTVVLKPSEMAPTYSNLIAKLVKKYFDPRLFTVVEGAVQETSDLLKLRWDHIMYTGNPTVAKIVMKAAAEHLTPVTLELGGKNPVVVLPDADLDDAAKKIIFSKMFNCGQICLAADYILTDENTKPKLVEALEKAYNSKEPLKENKEFARIVNEKHFDRLSQLLSNTKGKVLFKGSGEACKKSKYIPPHVLEINKDDAIMGEEIFGPIMPIVTVSDFDAAVEFIKDREKPLGAYIFTNCPEKAREFAIQTSSGGVTVNDVMMHAFAPNVPFGGVGNSGMGRINSKYGFDEFTHEKAVLIRNGLGDKLKACI